MIFLALINKWSASQDEKNTKMGDLDFDNLLTKRFINDSNNKLLIDIDSEIRTLELEPNYYNRNELVEFLNEGLNSI